LIVLGWWHHVQSIGDPSDNISVALNMFWNASEADWARKEVKYITGFRTKYDRK
jgi:hypothetical protein